ncbi:ff3ab49a-4357-427e-b1cd-b4cabbebcea1 [Sclerotinia trifoliorum]|uniref:Ff3ab49a-4357-427e-b1cd-b4cabbebcea1 n=1 Tax=Sclerotinia trifoliorum TaxID=28548 RepID=A0A8H2VWG3_9HELO|nr:ff3ab49a-4357-427e-b1cd-b4cabbebcea1 [Sclerotinia trifoliorum]
MTMESQSERKCLVKVSPEERSSQKSTSKRRRSQDSEDGTNTSNSNRRKRALTIDPSTFMNSNPAEKQYLELQACSKTFDRDFKKLAAIDNIIEDVLDKHRKLLDDNMTNFRNDFPHMTEFVWRDFLKAASNNQLLDQLDGCRRENEIICMDSRKKLAEMSGNLKNEYPNFKSQDYNIYVASHADSAITDNEQLAAFFANRSPKDVAKDYKKLPRFRITRCEEIHSRAELPPAYRASLERARRFPDHLGLISYDTAGVIHKIRNTQSRRDNDKFCVTLDDIWIYNETRKKYEPHPNQQIFHSAFQLEYYHLQRRKIVYVEISEEDLPKTSRSTQI